MRAGAILSPEVPGALSNLLFTEPQMRIVGPSPPSFWEEDRRRKIIRWLSVKMGDATYDIILEAAHRFEYYLDGNGAGRATFISSITKLDPKTGQILAAAAKKESDERPAPIGQQA